MSEYLAHSAKDGIAEQTYRQHVSEVLRMAREYAKRAAAYSPLGPLLLAAVEYAAAYHDLGKLDDDNQTVLRTGSKGSLPVKHWDAGTAYLLTDSKRWANLIGAFLVACHHKGLLSLPDEQVRGPDMFREASAKGSTALGLSGYLAVHAAEIGVGVSEQDWKGKAATPLFMRMALSCLVDADHTDTARHYGNVVPEGDMPLAAEQRLLALDQYVDGLTTDDNSRKERDEVRRQVYDACRTAQPNEGGMIACDSPVGTGKTTAVMAHLLKAAKEKGLRRVFVVLPFTNIIDQSVDVYRKALVLDGEESERVVAAHHHKAEFEEEANRAFSFLWNAPITVTTAVQFFETLASKHPATLRKLHQLAGSAIFIDEAHAALPAHLWPQAWKWLQELVKDWGCYIVMASGSLTRFWEFEEFSAPPARLAELVSLDVRSSAMHTETSRITYRIKNEAHSLTDLCDWIVQLPGPRLVILNTVQSAAAVARELAGAEQKNRQKVEHLSTALAPIDRKGVLERVKKRLGDKNDTDWTLVATSCVEAGVDLSFQSAAREMCSLVSTIQTAGRVNRSGEFGTCELWSFRIKASELLREHPAFTVSSRILADLYEKGHVSPYYCKEAMRREVRDRNRGRCEDDPIVKAEKKREFPEVDEKFKVIDSNTITVVVDDDLRQRLERRERVEPFELQQKSINIYSSKERTYGVAPIHGFEKLYRWTLKYDDFLGYMAGVLPLTNFADNCCI
ncbi:MAG: CRISPR-associated endonuclease Cas3'' [bacterium]